MKKQIKEINAETGIETTRDMTDEEIQRHDFLLRREEENEKLENAQADAKAALLERLGITADEAKLLLA